METHAPVFDEIYSDYLAQLQKAWSGLDLAGLGLVRQGQAVLATLFGQQYRIEPGGISDAQGQKPSHARCVVLANYLLAQPQGAQASGQWTSYRDFKDAAPYAASFAQYAEGAIAKGFIGRRDQLATACRLMGGVPPESAPSYDLCVQFTALSRVPMLLLFNDEEEGFPSSCSLLFDESAPRFLNMECLAILGLVLAEDLPKL